MSVLIILGLLFDDRYTRSIFLIGSLLCSLLFFSYFFSVS